MVTPLHDAAWKGHIDAMQLLIDNGANVNARNEWDRTPLHDASRNGHVDAMKLLIEHVAIK